MAKRFTGPGKIDIKSGGSVAIISASLYNFDVDDDEPKEQHLGWLDAHIVPLLEGASHHIWMRGTASQTGTDQHNIRLSRRRVERVAAHLTGKGADDWQLQTDWVGESLSRSVDEEDEQDRAVEIRVQPIGPDSQERSKPPPKPPEPPLSNHFALRLMIDVQLSRSVRLAKLLKAVRRLRKRLKVGVVTEAMFVEIRDIKNHLTALYVYVGGGLGVSIFKKIPVGATFEGPWNNFTTSKPIYVSQFDGFTRLTSAAVGGLSKNYIFLGGTPEGVDGVYMAIKTGNTWPGGLSTTVGVLTLLDVTRVTPNGGIMIRSGPERRVPIRTGP